MTNNTSGIRDGVTVHLVRGTPPPEPIVDVRVDPTGVGWGVYCTLMRMQQQGLLPAAARVIADPPIAEEPQQ